MISLASVSRETFFQDQSDNSKVFFEKAFGADSETAVSLAQIYSLSKLTGLTIEFLVPVVEGVNQLVTSPFGGRIQVGVSGRNKEGKRFYKIRMEYDSQDGKLTG